MPTTVDIYPWPNYPNTFAWDNKAIADEFAQYRDYNPKKAGAAPGRARDQEGVGGQPAVQRQTGDDEHHHTRAAGRLRSTSWDSCWSRSSSSSASTPASSTQPRPSTPPRSNRGTGTSARSGWAAPSSTRGRATQQFDSQYFEPIGKNALTFDQMRLKEPVFDATIAKLGSENPTAASTVPTFNEALTAVLHLPAGDPLPADGLLARHQHPVLDGLADKQEPVPDTQQLVGTIPVRHRQAEARYHVTNR